MAYSKSFDELFPDTRLEGDTPLRQGQLIMLRLLKIFDHVCREKGLTYWVESGTLLGAVRHGGFIPWDDDVDVMMPREHYEEFKVIASDELPYDVYLDKWGDYLKLRDRFSSRIPANGSTESDSVYIDIFPGLRFPSMRKTLARARMLIPPYELPGIPRGGSTALRLYRGALRAAAIALRVTGLMWVLRGLCLLGPRRYWSYDIPVTWHFHFRDDWIFPLRLMVFEDSKFFGPANPRAILAYQYGDFMTPPPVWERNVHELGEILPTTASGAGHSLRWEDHRDAKMKAAKRA